MTTPNQTLQNLDQTFKKINYLWDQFSQVAINAAEFEAKKLEVNFKEKVDELNSELEKAQNTISDTINHVEDYITNLTPDKAKSDLEKLNKQINSDIEDFGKKLDKSLKEEQRKIELAAWGTNMKLKVYEANQKLKASLHNLNDSFKSMGDAIKAQLDDSKAA